MKTAAIAATFLLALSAFAAEPDHSRQWRYCKEGMSCSHHDDCHQQGWRQEWYDCGTREFPHRCWCYQDVPHDGGGGSGGGGSGGGGSGGGGGGGY